jgi:hypothetical protein
MNSIAMHQSFVEVQRDYINKVVGNVNGTHT